MRERERERERDLTELCSLTWSESPKFLYLGSSLINLRAFFHGIVSVI